MVLYLILLSQSWSTTVPNFMLVSGIAQSGQNLALSRLAIRTYTTTREQIAKVVTGRKRVYAGFKLGSDSRESDLREK